MQRFVDEQEARQRPRAEGPAPDNAASGKPTDEEAELFGNPFPPGYGEDLLEE